VIDQRKARLGNFDLTLVIKNEHNLTESFDWRLELKKLTVEEENISDSIENESFLSDCYFNCKVEEVV
jgi:hypothetical protein